MVENANWTTEKERDYGANSFLMASLFCCFFFDFSLRIVAGVQDTRFQALMPDPLHFLGVTKIDNFISMSDMK